MPATGNPRDPLEPINRAIYQFNEGLDKTVVSPAAELYRGVLPQFVRTGVSNFFANINDVLIALNNLLQGKLPDAVSDVGRVAVNTTVGLLGVLDVATEIGLEKHDEDFGQTLGRWGVGDGPYLVLPFFGPSNLRDALATHRRLQNRSGHLRRSVARSQPVVGCSALSTAAPNCSVPARSWKPRRSIRMNSCATPTCSAAAI